MSEALFSSFTSEGLEKSEDVLGGYQVFPSDIYTATIKHAYADVSEGGAHFISFEFDLEGNTSGTYTEQVYFTNKEGNNFYINKDTNKKQGLPGFNLVNSICLLATGEELCKQKTEQKVIKVYDRTLQQQIPKEKPMIMALLGKKVKLAILKTIENKKVKSGDTWVDSTEEVERNKIDRVFHSDDMRTVNEIMEAKSASFYQAWLDKWKDKPKDTRKIRNGVAGTVASSAPARERPNIFEPS